MRQKPNQQIVHLSTVVNGWLVDGTVTFSPAPPSGVLTELAKFEAERLVQHMIESELAAGRL